MPSTEKSPVKDSDAPMTIGALVLAVGLVLGLVLPLLLQLASMAAVTAAVVPRNRNRVR